MDSDSNGPDSSHSDGSNSDSSSSSSTSSSTISGSYQSSHQLTRFQIERMQAIFSRVLPKLPVRGAVYYLWGLAKLGILRANNTHYTFPFPCPVYINSFNE